MRGRPRPCRPRRCARRGDSARGSWVPCRRCAHVSRLGGILRAVNKPPSTWCRVLEEEYRALYGADRSMRPRRRTDPTARTDARLRALHRRIHERGPSALCLSGGGIRSATFALGVLQGLAHVGVARHARLPVHGLRRRLHRRMVHRVAAPRRARRPRAGPADARPGARAACTRTASANPTTSLRSSASGGRAAISRRSGGVVSADVWTLVTTMSRNLVLNWLVILPLLAAALMVPRVYYASVQSVERGFVAPGAACSVRREPGRLGLPDRRRLVRRRPGLRGRQSRGARRPLVAGTLPRVVSGARRSSGPSRSRSSGRPIPAS